MAFECDFCGSSEAYPESMSTVVEYNYYGKILRIPMTLPVATCRYCDLSASTAETEAVKEEAITAFLKQLDT